jgi:hypothetical protein
MKSSIFWDVTPCSLLSSTDVSEEHIASIFRVEEIIQQEPDDGGDMFLRNVGCNSTDYTASHPRR